MKALVAKVRVVLSLDTGLLSRPTALDFAGFGFVDVMRRNPFCVEGLCRSDSRSISATRRDLIRRIASLRKFRRLLSSVASFATLTLLWEVGSNPDRIEEVDNADEKCQDEEVEENDLGIENASVRFHDADSTIEGLNSKEIALTIRHNSREVQPQLLRMHFGGEGIAQAFIAPCGNLNIVPGRRQVADILAQLPKNVQGPKAASDVIHSNRARLIICVRQ